ncbi:MAG TPA: sigma-70 family RNA polymerase sigma factor [Cyclobacteriaceae bacterium]
MTSSENEQIRPVVDNLFRHEAGKLVSVLTRIFGPHNLELAEDVVQDTLIKAMDNWKFNGIPENPTGWLFTAARNKALDVIRRERYQKEFAAEVSALLKSEYTAVETVRQFVNENEIEDEQLRMMFVCCHPTIAEEAQIALTLKTLCGFSVAEIAKAFLTNEETITKRLYRARQQFREEKIAFVIPTNQELPQRLDNVLVAIYLIFNEGYNSTSHDSLIRDDLVEESLRLGKMIVDHAITRKPESLALLALLCCQSARLYSRLDKEGNLLTLKNQDRSLWNQNLVRQGKFYLQQASQGNNMSSYHMEAAIAYEHCIAKKYDDTNWERILQLYDWLYQRKNDALTALNRLIVYAEVYGPEQALKESEQIKDKGLLKNYYLYPAALGEWYSQVGDKEKAKKYFENAMLLTQSKPEKALLLQKISNLGLA